MRSLATILFAIVCSQGLTKEPATILQQIESVVGDTWGEGDFGFKFISAEPYQKSVRVEFVITHKTARRAVRRKGEGKHNLPGRNIGTWETFVSGRNGKWRVVVWARDAKPIRGRLTNAAQIALTEAIGWTESVILNPYRASQIERGTQSCPEGF